MASYYSSKLPTSNLKAEDIRDTLSAGGGSVSNDTTTFFKAAAKINPFSKHKPIKLAADFCQDINSSNPNYDADWWKGDGNCGFTPKSVASLALLVTEMEKGDEMNGWVYNLPTGGSTSPFRLGDFAGYLATAKPFSFNLNVPATASNQFSTNTFFVTAMGNALNSDSVSWADFSTLKNYYFGVYLVRQENTANTVRVTGTSTLESGGASVEVNAGLMLTGTYKVYPFIAQNKIAQKDADSANYFYTVPKVSIGTIKIVSSYITVMVTATLDTAMQTISYTVKVKNDSTSAQTFNNNTMWLRYYGKSLTDTLVFPEQKKTLSDGLVAAGGTTTTIASGTFSMVDPSLYDPSDPDYKNGCEVWCSLNSGNYYDKTVVFTVAPI